MAFAGVSANISVTYPIVTIRGSRAVFLPIIYSNPFLCKLLLRHLRLLFCLVHGFTFLILCPNSHISIIIIAKMPIDTHAISISLSFMISPL